MPILLEKRHKFVNICKQAYNITNRLVTVLESVVGIFANLRKGGFSMQVTDVRIRKIATGGKMKAVVSLTIDECFAVHDIKVIESQNGLFIAMPSRKTPDGQFKDIAHPINSETRKMLEKLILEKYAEVEDEPEPVME